MDVNAAILFNLVLMVQTVFYASRTSYIFFGGISNLALVPFNFSSVTFVACVFLSCLECSLLVATFPIVCKLFSCVKELHQEFFFSICDTSCICIQRTYHIETRVFPMEFTLRGGADKSLARPTSRCRRMESIVSLEIEVCSCAEFKYFLVTWAERKHGRRRALFRQHEEASCHQVFFLRKARRRRKFTTF